VEQPLSRSVLEDTSVRATMEIMMAWSSGVFVYLLAACRTRSQDTWQLSSYHELDDGCWSPGATWRSRSCLGPGGVSRSHGGTWWPRSCPEPRGGSQSRGDMWQPRSCPQPGGGSYCLDLMLVRWGTRSSGYRQQKNSTSVVSSAVKNVSLYLCHVINAALVLKLKLET
jgi:hypothetical protein